VAGFHQTIRSYVPEDRVVKIIIKLVGHNCDSESNRDKEVDFQDCEAYRLRVE
jgi:hypothetical protein